MNSHRRPPLFMYPFPILFPRDLSGGKSPCGGRNIFIRTKKYLLAEGKIFLHIRKFIFAYTKKYFCIYRNLFTCAQKKSFVAWRKISMSMEKIFYGHGIFTPCRRRFFCISFRQKFLLFLRRVSRAFALPCLQNIVPVRCPVSGCPMPDLLYFVATTVLLSEIYCVILCPNRIVQMPAGMGKTTQDSNAERT